MKLKTSDVRQADSLALVRRLLEAIAVSPSTAVKDLAEKTKFSERHVRYRLQAARILGFLKPEGEPDLTSRAKRLLATDVGTPEEKKQLASAVADCASVQLILNPIQNTKFRVRRDGAEISKEDVDNAFTQIRPAALTLSPGLRFKAKDADFDLVVELGRGAVAQVWKCQRIRDRKDFAVKIVDPEPTCLTRQPSTT